MNLAGCARLERLPLTGTWYRAIQPQHWPTQDPQALYTYTRVIPTRFSAGADQFTLLYFGENHLVALFEVRALLGSLTQLVPHPRQTWVTLNAAVQLQSVVDLTQEAEGVRLFHIVPAVRVLLEHEGRITYEALKDEFACDAAFLSRSPFFVSCTGSPFPAILHPSHMTFPLC